MGKVRGELEDLAFRYTDPISYEQVAAAVESRRVEGEQFLRSVEDTLTEQLRENNIEARVEWRIKRIYSIFQSSSVPKSPSTRSMTCWPSASSPRMWLPATPSSA